MYILGLTHPYSWNTAAALLKDGALVAFAEEERFTRVKHAPRSFPQRSMDYCLKQAGITLDQVDHIAIGMDSLWSVILPNLSPHQPLRFTYGKILRTMREIRRGNAVMPFSPKDKRVKYLNHHLSHIASSFYLSGFDRANFISLDGAGGGESGMLGWGEGTELHILNRVTNAGSWGALYERITKIIGFRPHSHEGKTMGLAAFGTPKPEIIDFIDWGKPIPQINHTKRNSFLQRLTPRKPGEELTQEHKDLAATIQDVLERALLQMAKYLVEQSGSRALCMAGGVALNCSANGKIYHAGIVDDIYIQPASSDAGVALGAAVLRHVQVTGERPKFVFDHAYWGPEYSDAEIEKVLKEAKVSYEKCSSIEQKTAELLKDGKIVGWFQGRMEVGPRALGGRSILADPSIPGIKDKVNAEVKHREMWRPFAPSMHHENMGDYVEHPYVSPFMILAFHARKDHVHQFEAAVHVDGTARVQGVTSTANPLYYRLIDEFKKLTGRGVILNTSFNVAEEPLVCSPTDALRTYYCSGMDALAMGSFLLRKAP
ncbi:MAG: carbamoyltransferase C-terminal domain-containing protein [Candidatus Peregrinibacteria bacterium]|nr:carbamoyltransferase C-terminal domain-containing protein [Candidatus Peregrinibacteria bacterium]